MANVSVNEYIYVDVDVDVDVEDFYKSMSTIEIEKELLPLLAEDGYLKGIQDLNGNYISQVFSIALQKLNENRLSLTSEEEEMILNIAKRF